MTTDWKRGIEGTLLIYEENREEIRAEELSKVHVKGWEYLGGTYRFYLT